MKSSHNPKYFMIISNNGFSLDKLEEELILQALENSQYNKSQAARMLGISRSRLRSKLKRLRIKL